MNFEETSYISNVRKNDQNKFHIFGKDFSVKKSKKNIQKKQFFNFFLKTNTFLIIVLIVFFFMENRQTESKTSQNLTKTCVHVILITLGEKQLNLNILKCVKVNKSFLSLFQVIPSLIPVII